MRVGIGAGMRAIYLIDGESFVSNAWIYPHGGKLFIDSARNYITLLINMQLLVFYITDLN